MNRRTFTRGIGAALLALNLHLVPVFPSKPSELLWFEHEIRHQLKKWTELGLIHPNWEFDGEKADVTLRGVIHHITINGTVSV